jgi:hypothetical protein
VTLLTAHTKLTVMHILTLMARDAIASQVRCIFAFRCFFLMAAFTGKLAMRAVQSVIGAFVMIEIPQLPGSGVMAILTAFTEFEFVLIFLLVASVAFPGRILVTSCLVAALASGSNVPPRERKTRQTVVKLLYFPVFVSVTAPALLASLPLMLVILFMATVTIGSSFSVAGQVFVA